MNLRILLATALLVASGCKHIPAESYGVERVRIHGAKAMDGYAIKACLATKERDRFQFALGTPMDLECGDPPFDGGRLPVKLWTWPMTEWPVLDLNVWKRDVERIERWYRARGYYDAKVTGARFSPAQAAERDRFTEEAAPCGDADEGRGCPVRIDVYVEEGEPVLVTRIDFDGADVLGRDLVNRVRRGSPLKEGARFDEAYYDEMKRSIGRELRRAGYPCAYVTGEVSVDPSARTAEVRFAARRGPLGRIASVEVEIDGESKQPIPTRTIRATAMIKRGTRYDPATLADAQQAVYALGAFASVEVDAEPRRDEAGICTGEVDVTIRARPGRDLHYGVGGGLQSGTFTERGTTDVLQWDVHLITYVEHRNFFGGLRRFRVEDRPKLVFQNLFPVPTNPAPGNELHVEFRQPAFLEPRTTLTIGNGWDVGPDPIQRSVYRHEVETYLLLSRGFFDGRLQLSGGIRSNVYRVVDRFTPDQISLQTSPYHLVFLEQRIQLDLRDDARRTTRGAFFRLGLQEAGFFLPASWDYVRLTPEARGYIPLPANLVIAGRFGLGMTFIRRASDSLDPASHQLGPTAYRLRGGGPSSHRGFLPGTLGQRGERIPGGDPNAVYLDTDGGTRRWEASLELRTQLTRDFGMTFFTDMGDVSRPILNTATGEVEDARFRFNYLHLAVGLGFRYFTVVGPFRLDLGILVPGAQVIGEPSVPLPNALRIGGLRIPGSLTLSLGEAF
ncbi:MAG: BamA/TamA family outer membrane protein [Myxococcales bacterium]|nr:BamA/TamA family outer membrane protein [Myxococcales bacterium]